jgi:hypothetical protein
MRKECEKVFQRMLIMKHYLLLNDEKTMNNFVVLLELKRIFVKESIEENTNLHIFILSKKK